MLNLPGQTDGTLAICVLASERIKEQARVSEMFVARERKTHKVLLAREKGARRRACVTVCFKRMPYMDSLGDQVAEHLYKTETALLVCVFFRGRGSYATGKAYEILRKRRGGLVLELEMWPRPHRRCIQMRHGAGSGRGGNRQGLKGRNIQFVTRTQERNRRARRAKVARRPSNAPSRLLEVKARETPD